MNEPSDYVTIKVLFFAAAREFIGEKEALVSLPKIISGKGLLDFIISKFNLDQLKCNIIIALNESWIDLQTELCLKESDEIAVIPPLSGAPQSRSSTHDLYSRLSIEFVAWQRLANMDYVKLTNDKLSIESVYSMVCSAEYGAVSLFIGTTRNNFEGKVVTKLEYEAYEGMATKSLKNICHKVREKFPVGNIAIFHRLGEVPIKEASVIIAISSTHRKASLEAVPYAIDALKADVPIWKKEFYEDEETSEWKENSECAWSRQ